MNKTETKKIILKRKKQTVLGEKQKITGLSFEKIY